MSPKFHPAFLFCGLLAAVSVSAKTFNVAVGDNNGLVFNPTSITGAVAGDQVVFTFMSKNHSVTQSTFANPCTRSGPTAFDSGFKPATTGSQPAVTFTLDQQSASAPQWFYCAQKAPVNHCQNGMVFAINPTADKTFEQYQVNAKNSANTPPPSGTSGAPTPTSTASGAIHTVIVGSNAQLIFDPPSLQAAAGDTIAFTFVSKNHSATQSTFDNPCAPGGDGLNSGFQAVPQNSTQAFQWKITLDATSASKPLWFYCAQTVPVNHCHTGMVFAVNPTPDKSFDAFKNNAVKAVTSSSAGTSSGSGAVTATSIPTTAGGSGDASTSADKPTQTSSGSTLYRINVSVLVAVVSIIASFSL